MKFIISNFFYIRNFLFIIQKVAVVVKTCIICGGIFVMNDSPSIYRSRISTCYTTIVHTVHHHRLQIAAGGCYVIVTHNTAAIRATINFCVIITVDNACSAVKQANDTTNLFATSYTTPQHTTVVDTCIACCFAADCSRITVFIATADADIVKDYIFDSSPISVSNQRISSECQRIQITINNAFKRIISSTNRS